MKAYVLRKFFITGIMSIVIMFICGDFASAQGVAGDNFQSFTESLSQIPETDITRTKTTITRPRNIKSIRRDVQIRVRQMRKDNKSGSVLRMFSTPPPSDPVEGWSRERVRAFAKSNNIPTKISKPGKKEDTDRGGPKFQLSLDSAYAYTSNATNVKKNTVHDRFFNVSPALKLKLPVGSENDSLSFLVKPTFVRYDKNPGFHRDFLATQIAYDGTLKFPNTSNELGYVLFFNTHSSFNKGFGPYLNSLYTPGVTLKRGNIGLDHGNCGTKSEPEDCLSASLSATLDHTFVEKKKENQNTRITLLGKLTRKIPNHPLKIIASSSVAGKAYDDFPQGGRQDLIFAASGGLNWTFGSFASLTTSVKYTNQQSTQTLKDWQGVVFSLSVNVDLNELFHPTAK